MSPVTRRPGSTSVSRSVALLVVALVAATGLTFAPAATAEVRAATPDLTIVGNARYDVQPENHRVRVTVDLVMTNHLKDTRTKRYYFDRAFLSVLPGSSGFKLTSNGAGAARAAVSKKTSSYTLLELNLGRRIYSGKTNTYRLVFDLVDKGGAARRDIRVGSSLVSFPVWAFATDSTPGSSVKVTFPAGYEVEVQSGEMPAPKTAADGTTTLQTGKLAKPLAFFAYLVGDRSGSYAERSVTTTVGDKPVDLLIRAWTDDEAWATRVGDLVSRGLPILSDKIGLPWPREEGLAFHETITRTTGGYAGLFDPSLGQVEVAYDAGDFVVLHESAHTWFNGALLVDRWANEAFASYYGLEAADALKVKINADTLTPELEAARIPLNAWGSVGREADATEDYAYAATLALAREIAERAGTDGLRAVWTAAANKIGAYQPSEARGGAASPVGAVATDPETVDGPPDWRALLDLLEDTTGKTYADLWRTWVARETDLPLLDARAEARTEYDAVTAAAGEWRLPRAVRDAMRAWQFDQARTMLGDATAVLDKREEIATDAAAAGLTLPDTLRTAFESPDGFATATLEATGEQAVIDEYEQAVAARPTAVDGVASIGLWGTDPQADLERARTLFAAGDLGGSAAAAGAAEAAWTGAADAGRNRLMSVGILVLALLLGLIILAVWLRGRRTRVTPSLSSATATTLPTSAAAWPDEDATIVYAVPSADPDSDSFDDLFAPDSYATLAATPDPAAPVDVGDDRARGAEPD
jgi:hypothetical protein